MILRDLTANQIERLATKGRKKYKERERLLEKEEKQIIYETGFSDGVKALLEFVQNE